MDDPTDLSSALSSAEAVFRKRSADVRGEVGLNGTKTEQRLVWICSSHAAWLDDDPVLKAFANAPLDPVPESHAEAEAAAEARAPFDRKHWEAVHELDGCGNGYSAGCDRHRNANHCIGEARQIASDARFAAHEMGERAVKAEKERNRLRDEREHYQSKMLEAQAENARLVERAACATRRLPEFGDLSREQIAGLAADTRDALVEMTAERDRLAAELFDAKNDALETIDGHKFVCTVCGDPRDGHIPRTMRECAEGLARDFTVQHAELIAAKRERDRLAAELADRTLANKQLGDLGAGMYADINTLKAQLPLDAPIASENVALRARLSELEAELDKVKARALLSRAAATIREHLEALPKCDRSDLGCQRPATRAYRRGEGRWCDEHGYDPHGSPPDYPRAKTVRELTALLGEIGSVK